MKEIKLTQNKVALVDNEDFEKVNKFKWSLKVDAINKRYYTQRHVWLNNKRVTQSMHRFILNLTDPKVKTDHKDGDGLNNQKENLRECNDSQNQMNSRIRSDNVSGYKGVYWSSWHKKWVTYLSFYGKRIYGGYFSSKVEAAKIYNKIAKTYFGDFAKLNTLKS